MKIYITGANGFIGYHLTQYIKYLTDFQLMESKNRFQEDLDLIAESDIIIHLAGVNRGDDIYVKNIEITNQLIEMLSKSRINKRVIFASSTQEGNGTEYGNSKRDAYQLLKKCGIEVTSIKIPNIFGPFCKPNYNSFVSTFCSILNNGSMPEIIQDNQIELMYVMDLCDYICSLVGNNDNEMKTTKINVSEVLNRLNYFNIEYNIKNTMPEISTQFDIDLFNTFRSFSNPVKQLDRKVDDRGYLIECLRSRINNNHIFYSSTKPDVVRGNHFHFRKVERFIIIKGSAKIEFQKLGDKKVQEFFISSEDNLVIDIPVMNIHTLKNIGDDELICCFWTNEIFDPNKPDTYFQKIVN